MKHRQAFLAPLPGRNALSVYRLHRIILSCIISLIDLSAALWLFVVVIGKCFVRPDSPIVHHSFSRFTLRFFLIGLLGFLIQQVSKKSNRGDSRMSFKKLADKTFAKAWERYHGSMTPGAPPTSSELG
jgi:hypothetical protein